MTKVVVPAWIANSADWQSTIKLSAKLHVLTLLGGYAACLMSQNEYDSLFFIVARPVDE